MKNRLLYLVVISVYLLLTPTIGSATEKPVVSKDINLVPEKNNQTPDYFNTWNVQGYICNYKSSPEQRSTVLESNIFGKGKYQGWVDLFPKNRNDLIFLLDDSWDSPCDSNLEYYGLLILNEGRFPSFYGTPTERLTKLVKAVESRGWRGVGLWICAQQAPLFREDNDDAYWIERLKWSQEAGVDYWKVDWGKHSSDLQWRRKLTELGRIHAPDLIIEHAINDKAMEYSDVFRTYDVENIVSIPVTIRRIGELLQYKIEKDAAGLICCEDEPYIAAALGCSIGIQRHPFNGVLPDGRQDFCFPPVGRDLKSRLDCEVRATRWHRIAPPFSVSTNIANIDQHKLEDYWIINDNETWRSRKVGEKLAEKAPARISRGLPLATISSPDSDKQPYVLAARYPNGAISIATIGRTIAREYFTTKEDITLQIPDLNNPIGVFGDYGTLTFAITEPVNTNGVQILAQDLAGNKAVDITDRVMISRNKLTLSGELIREIGLMAATPGDKSEPGLVIFVRFEKEK